MTTKEGRNYFGSYSLLSKFCGLSPRASCYWGKYPSPSHQVFLQSGTNQELTAEDWVFSPNSKEIRKALNKK